MSAIRRLTFTTSQGHTLDLNQDSGLLFNYVDGIGDVEANLYTQIAPFQDGGTYIDSTLQMRTIAFIVNIVGNGDDDISYKRGLLSSYFNPKLGEGILSYTYGSKTRILRCVSQHVPQFATGMDNRRDNYQRASVTLLCPIPFWEDEFEKRFKLEDFGSAFKFPFHLPTKFATRGDFDDLYNGGVVPTPLEIEFHGPATNPVISKKSTGEFIKVNQTIPEGYILYINTGFGNKRVEIISPDGTRTNAFNYLTIDSTFFMLDVGENAFGFITDGGDPEVYITYRNRFLSI